MKGNIMSKITFITLMMILGMSSVSFGKSYLCISEIGKFIDKSDGQYESSRITPKKIIIKTEDNDNRMISVKFFGKEYFICKDGQNGWDGESLETLGSGMNVSTKGGHFLSCRVPYLKEYGGHIKIEFILNLEFMKFDYYHNSENIQMKNWGTSIIKGKCEEI